MPNSQGDCRQGVGGIGMEKTSTASLNPDPGQIRACVTADNRLAEKVGRDESILAQRRRVVARSSGGPAGHVIMLRAIGPSGLASRRSAVVEAPGLLAAYCLPVS
jgi:hypothetical protein